MGKDIYEAIKPEKTKTAKAKKPMNKDSLIIAIVIAVVILLTAGIVAYYFWGVNSEVIVTYKGGKVTRGEYEAVYRYWAPQLVYYGLDGEAISDMVVDEILLNEVIYKKATEAGYTISDEDKETVESQFTDADSIAALRSNSINPDILKDFFYKNAVVSAYLNDIEEGATTDQIKAAIIKSEGENADLNLYNTRHIVILADDTSTEEEKTEALSKARDLLDKIKKGEDFATLAKENGQDGTATNGGEFSMVNNVTVAEAYRNAVLTLDEGELYGEVVETEYGYHVIKLESIEKDGRLTNADDVDMFVNDVINDAILEVFDKEDPTHAKELENAKAVASKLNSELGIVSTSEE